MPLFETAEATEAQSVLSSAKCWTAARPDAIAYQRFVT